MPMYIYALKWCNVEYYALKQVCRSCLDYRFPAIVVSSNWLTRRSALFLI